MAQITHIHPAAPAPLVRWQLTPRERAARAILRHLAELLGLLP